MTLRVALDARALQDRPLGGVGRGLASLLPLLATTIDLELLTDGRRPPAPTDLPQHALRGPLTARSVSWLQLAAPQFLRGFDGLFHCPLYGLPYWQPVPMVVTIHDLTFEDHPEWFARSQRAAFQLQGRHAARTARRILTDSEAVRARVLDRYGVAEDRVVVVPFAVDPAFRAPRDAAADRALVEALGVRGPYVLALGGAPRRRVEVAVAAWRRTAAHSDVDLVIVGSDAGAEEPRVHRVGRPDDGTWTALLAQAAVLAYPTLYEGFGLPAVEAAAVGTPVVCAAVGSLPEVLGDAAEWCIDAGSEAIAAGLDRVLGDAGHANDLRVRGRARVAQLPGWAEAATRTVAVYEAALDG